MGFRNDNYGKLEIEKFLKQSKYLEQVENFFKPNKEQDFDFSDEQIIEESPKLVSFIQNSDSIGFTDIENFLRGNYYEERLESFVNEFLKFLGKKEKYVLSETLTLEQQCKNIELQEYVKEYLLKLIHFVPKSLVNFGDFIKDNLENSIEYAKIKTGASFKGNVEISVTESGIEFFGSTGFKSELLSLNFQKALLEYFSFHNPKDAYLIEYFNFFKHQSRNQDNLFRDFSNYGGSGVKLYSSSIKKNDLFFKDISIYGRNTNDIEKSSMFEKVLSYGNYLTRNLEDSKRGRQRDFLLGLEHYSKDENLKFVIFVKAIEKSINYSSKSFSSISELNDILDGIDNVELYTNSILKQLMSYHLNDYSEQVMFGKFLKEDADDKTIKVAIKNSTPIKTVIDILRPFFKTEKEIEDFVFDNIRKNESFIETIVKVRYGNLDQKKKVEILSEYFDKSMVLENIDGEFYKVKTLIEKNGIKEISKAKGIFALNKLIGVNLEKETYEHVELKQGEKGKYLSKSVEHQIEAHLKIEEAFRDGNAFVIADGVGLGKTFVGCSTIGMFLETTDKNILVISTASVIGQGSWETTLQTIGYSEKEYGDRVYFCNNNPQSIKNTIEGVKDIGLVVIDEAHHFRNLNSQRAKIISGLVEENGSKVLLLTATPINNSLNDLINILLIGNSYQQIVGSSEVQGNIDNDQYMQHKLSRFVHKNTRESILKKFGKIKINGNEIPEGYPIINNVQVEYSEEHKENLKNFINSTLTKGIVGDELLTSYKGDLTSYSIDGFSSLFSKEKFVKSFEEIAKKVLTKKIKGKDKSFVEQYSGIGMPFLNGEVIWFDRNYEYLMSFIDYHFNSIVNDNNFMYFRYLEKSLFGAESENKEKLLQFYSSIQGKIKDIEDKLEEQILNIVEQFSNKFEDNSIETFKIGEKTILNLGLKESVYSNDGKNKSIFVSKDSTGRYTANFYKVELKECGFDIDAVKEDLKQELTELGEFASTTQKKNSHGFIPPLIGSLILKRMDSSYKSLKNTLERLSMKDKQKEMIRLTTMASYGTILFEALMGKVLDKDSPKKVYCVGDDSFYSIENYISSCGDYNKQFFVGNTEPLKEDTEHYVSEFGIDFSSFVEVKKDSKIKIENGRVFIDEIELDKKKVRKLLEDKENKVYSTYYRKSEKLIDETLEEIKRDDVLAGEIIEDEGVEDFVKEKLFSQIAINGEEIKEVLKRFNKFLDNGDKEKLDKLVEIITNEEDKKWLVFTSYTDTLNVVYETLKKTFPDKNIKCISGGTDKSTRGEIIRAFSPIANGVTVEKEIDILIATDSLSEGVNLQDCSREINFDLPFNPVRTQQRVGRLFRLGAKEIPHIYNFVPTTLVEQILGLMEKISYKEEIANSFFGIVEDKSLTATKSSEELIEEVKRVIDGSTNYKNLVREESNTEIFLGMKNKDYLDELSLNQDGKLVNSEGEIYEYIEENFENGNTEKFRNFVSYSGFPKATISQAKLILKSKSNSVIKKLTEEIGFESIDFDDNKFYVCKDFYNSRNSFLIIPFVGGKLYTGDYVEFLGNINRTLEIEQINDLNTFIKIPKVVESQEIDFEKVVEDFERQITENRVRLTVDDTFENAIGKNPKKNFQSSFERINLVTDIKNSDSEIKYVVIYV